LPSAPTNSIHRAVTRQRNRKYFSGRKYAEVPTVEKEIQLTKSVSSGHTGRRRSETPTPS
jgi:hypothetical protein